MEKRYIQTFETGESLQEALNIKKLGKPYVAYVEDEQSIDWNTKEIDYAGTYLTIEALEDGRLNVRIVCQYSINGGEWVSASYPVISVLKGDIIRFKGNVDSANIMFQDNTFAFNVYGNIMSLKYGDNFKGQTTVFSVQRFFQNSTGLTSAEHLVLPATILTNGCYQHMFAGCRSLVSAPSLPAMTLAKNCYERMFDNCISLTSAPELPATTLADSCYFEMFQGCTLLTIAPVLPATTLVNNCYRHMFLVCASLNCIKCLATDISAFDCTEGWLSDVSPTGTFVKNPNMSSWTTGIHGIPTGWTVEDATV